MASQYAASMPPSMKPAEFARRDDRVMRDGYEIVAGDPYFWKDGERAAQGGDDVGIQIDSARSTPGTSDRSRSRSRARYVHGD